MSTETRKHNNFKQKYKKMKKTLKLKLFNLIFEMHSIIHFNPTLAGILLSIDFIVNIVLIVYLRIDQLSDSTDDLFINQIDLMGFVDGILFINEVNYGFNMFLIAAIFYFLIILATTDPKKPRRKGQAWKINIMIIVLYSIHTCLSTFIIASQVVNIFCPSTYQNFVCLEGNNVDSAIIASLGIVAFLLNSYFIENVYNFQFMGINGETGILSNSKTFTLTMPLLKYFCYAIFYSGLPDTITSTMFICASLIYLIQLYLRFNQSYNFSKFLSEIEVTGIAICAFNYALCVLINALNFKMTDGDFVVAFLINVSLAYLIYLLKKNSWNNKLNQNFLAMKSIPAKEIYAYRMIECIMKFTFQDQLILSGQLKTHKRICQNKKCICSFEKMMKHIKDESHKQKLLEFKLSKAGIEFQDLLKSDMTKNESKDFGIDLEFQGSLSKIKNPQQLLYLTILLNWLDISYLDFNQHRMRIIQSYVITEYLQKDLKALFLLSTLVGQKLNMQEQFAIFCYQKIIFDKVNHRIRNLNQQSLDIQQIQKSISTEKKLSKLYLQMEQTVVDCQLFWKMIENKEKDLDFQKIHSVSMQISKNALKADRVYRQIRELQPTYYNIIIIYYRFLKHVLNYENDSFKEQNELSLAIQKRRIQNLKFVDFQNELFDLNKKIGTIVLRASKQTMGRISQINNEIQLLTKYKSEKLKNSNISVLFPSVMDESSHNACLEHFFLERTHSTFINQKKNLWIKDKNGFILAVDFYVQPFYDQIHGLQLIAYVKQTETMIIKDIEVQGPELFTVLTDWKGKIHCGSQNLSNFLKFNNSYDLKNSDINVNQLFIQLEELIQGDELESGVETDLVLSELNFEVGSNSDDNFLPKPTVTATEMSHDSIQEQESDTNSIFTRSLNRNHNNTNFRYYKQKTMKINLKSNLKYLNNHKYFNFGVFYFSFIKKEKIQVQTLEITDNQSEHLDQLKNQIDLEGSITASSASSSNSKNLKQINNLKSEYEIKKAPKIIGIFQKLFITYFMVFLGLSIGIMVMSELTYNSLIEDLDQYYTSRVVFYELVEIRKNVREHILLQNNQTSKTSNLINNRGRFIEYSIDNKIQIMKNLINTINEYVLTNEAVIDHKYAQQLKHENINLNTIDQYGNITGIQYTFIPGIQQLISKIQIILSSTASKCNCYFRFQELVSDYIYKENERDYFFVDNNSVDILGRTIFQKSEMLEHIMETNSENLKNNLLYFVIPGIFVSVLCSVLFFPVLIKMINNRKSVIQMLARIKITTSKQAAFKLKRFTQDLAQNKNKKRDYTNFYDNPSYHDDVKNMHNDTNENQESLNQQSLQEDNLDDRSINSSQMEMLERAQYRQQLDQSIANKTFTHVIPKSQGLTATQLEEMQKFQQKYQTKLDQINQQIDQQFHKQKIINIIKIFTLSLIYCMFFIALYFLDTKAAFTVPETIDILTYALDRGSCLSAVPQYVRQRLISNSTPIVGFLDSNIDSLFTYCLANANNLQDLRKSAPLSLMKNSNLLSEYEDFSFCNESDTLIKNDQILSSINAKPCINVTNGIMKLGIQQTYQYMLAEFRKYEIQFENNNGSVNSLNSQILDQRFIDLQDSITLYVKPVISSLNEQIYDTLMDYYKYLKQISIIFFAVFVVILFMAIILIIVYLLQIIQRELYFNKKVIKFIPIEELQRKSMTKILKTINL